MKKSRGLRSNRNNKPLPFSMIARSLLRNSTLGRAGRSSSKTSSWVNKSSLAKKKRHLRSTIKLSAAGQGRSLLDLKVTSLQLAKIEVPSISTSKLPGRSTDLKIEEIKDSLCLQLLRKVR